MYTSCTVCGSQKIIPGVSIQDMPAISVSAHASREHVVRIGTNPRALWLNPIIESKVKGYICGECGYMALFMENPHELYEAYQRYLSNTRK